MHRFAGTAGVEELYRLVRCIARDEHRSLDVETTHSSLLVKGGGGSSEGLSDGGKCTIVIWTVKGV
jgi:hypothetical protein